ncbi:hypothetical protein KCU71_g842, partial [Aureobasidium melanogenum]
MPSQSLTSKIDQSKDQVIVSIVPRVAGATHQAPKQWLDELDPEWVEMWNAHGGCHRQAEEVGVEEVRKDPAAYSFTYPTWAGPEVHQENEFDIPVTKPAGLIKVRVYTPEGTGPFPVHLNYHGGGWILGGLHSEAAWCRSVCNKISIVIVDVDYRLAPEFVFPAAIHDSWDAIQWVIAHAEELNVNAGSISIGGLSAGGHMSAVLSHMARDAGLELKLALMIVPSTDFRWLIAAEPLRSDVAKQYPSTALYKDAPWGGLKREQWFLEHWIPNGLNNAQSEARQLEDLSFHDFEHNDISNLTDLTPGALRSGDTDAGQGDFWLDQAMLDIDMQAYNYINTPPEAAAIPQGASRSPTSTQQEMFKIACGLTGDMDPYVMQRYNFDSNNNFVFKRLTVQSMSQDIHPVQLLAYNQPECIDSSLKAVQVLARDYDATLRKVQLSMEELNQWSSLALDIETEARSEDVNLSGPMLLGGHFVKVLLFRAILRPFQTTFRDADPGVVDLREAEAYRLSRAGARACVTSFVAFTADLKSGWVHGFWPFCTSPS